MATPEGATPSQSERLLHSLLGGLVEGDEDHEEVHHSSPSLRDGRPSNPFESDGSGDEAASGREAAATRSPADCATPPRRADVAKPLFGDVSGAGGWSDSEGSEAGDGVPSLPAALAASAARHSRAESSGAVLCVRQCVDAFRAVAWRTHLGLLSPGDSVNEARRRVMEARDAYEALTRRLIVSADGLDRRRSMSPTRNNPLSLDERSSWFRFFSNHKLTAKIRLDVNRTHADDAFFQAESTRDMLDRQLLLWSLENDDLSYRQGMNDLLALVVIALREDVARPVPSDYPRALAAIVDPFYLEHDSYTIFSALMRKVKPWFGPGMPTPEHPVSALGDLFVRVHHELLPAADPQLYRAMERHGILPQLYLLRWVRVLFTREFTVPQSLDVWDSLLAHGRGLELVDHMCLAMLVRRRRAVIEARDSSVVLLALLNYPPTTGDVGDVVRFALLLQHRPAAALSAWAVDFPDDAEACEAALELERAAEADAPAGLTREASASSAGPRAGGTGFSSPFKSIVRRALGVWDDDGAGGSENRPNDRHHRRESSFGIKDARHARGHSISAFVHKTEGYLHKVGGGTRRVGRKSLKRRYFVLRNGELMYYADQAAAREPGVSPLKNTRLRMAGRVVSVVDRRKFHFRVSGLRPSDRSYDLYASDRADLVRWVGSLQDAASCPMSELSTSAAREAVAEEPEEQEEEHEQGQGREREQKQDDGNGAPAAAVAAAKA